MAEKVQDRAVHDRRVDHRDRRRLPGGSVKLTCRVVLAASPHASVSVSVTV